MLVVFRLLPLALVLVFSNSLSAADNLFSEALNGPPPTIDGVRGVDEWTGPPSLQLTGSNYPIDTNVYFRHDSQNLYVLVDAIGDVNDDNWDECLLVFDLPPDYKIAEMWKDGTGTTVANPGTIATSYALGMTSGHRTYEFQIPFSNLGIQPGQSIPFYSPAILKGPGWYGDNVFASMPYDASDGDDNVYPYDLDITTDDGSPPDLTGVSNYSVLRVSVSAVSVPTLNEWGLAIIAILLAAMAGWFGRRRQGLR